MLKDVTHPSGFSLRITDTPVKLGRTPGGIQGPPPAIGQHTDDVLRGMLGMDDEEIAGIRERSVVFGPLPSPVGKILEHETKVAARDDA
jgi:succinate--hydroxymethylglutarate CoA-transferase